MSGGYGSQALAPAEYLQPEFRLAAALKALRLSSSVRVAARSATSSRQAHLQLGQALDRVVHLTDGQAEPVPVGSAGAHGQSGRPDIPVADMNG